MVHLEAAMNSFSVYNISYMCIVPLYKTILMKINELDVWFNMYFVKTNIEINCFWS